MATFLNQLSNNIWKNTAFHEEYASLHSASIKKSLIGATQTEISDSLMIQRLLQSAVILAGSNNPQHRQAAYRIAIGSLTLFQGTFPNLQNVLHVIFGRLGNFPAADYLYRVLNKEKQYAIPSSALYELLHHEKQNTVHSGTQEIILTDFQCGLWKALESNSNVSVSVPTSAGKSFALQQYITRSLTSDQNRFILYMVPTRALIHQVSDAINELLDNDILVSTIPQTPEELGMDRGVFVLTQERTHVLLDASPDIRFQMIVLDEAQTIGEGARGVLLQVVIERLLKDNPQAKFFFGSPFSRNPDHFDYMFKGSMVSVKETSSPVSQNLIFADIDSVQTRKLSLSLFDEIANDPIDLAEIQLEEDVQGDEQTFAYLSYLLGEDSKNLVYSGSPAKCESVADKIRQWIDIKQPDDFKPEEELKEFATLIRDHIHKDYLLADMIERGIAFHYGKMPTLIRKAIEYYFANHDAMKYLVCTSTLLHGVNLPAKNLFILKPSEGDKWLTRNATPMGSTSFWNLAGRAGRLGKDFEGNVFLVNKSQWDNDPTEGIKEQTIKSSFYNTIRDYESELLTFASDGDVDADGRVKQSIESTFVKLFCDYRQGHLQDTLNKSPVDLPDTFVTKFSSTCQQLSFDVPVDIIEENIGMSPFRQQRMLDYIQGSIDSSDFDKLIPPHPQNNSYQGYVRLLSRFERYFDGDGTTPASGRPKYLASIAMLWMRGTPYPQIIQKSREKNPNKALPSLIRELMETIENQLRFKAVQQTRCYLALLQHAFKVNNLSHLNQSIPSIALYLELGACSGTMVNLIGLGLSRTTSGLLNQKAASGSMDRGQCISWFLRENWEASDLPKVCVSEIEGVLSMKS